MKNILKKAINFTRPPLSNIRKVGGKYLIPHPINRIYQTMIKPIITYGSSGVILIKETGVIKTIENLTYFHILLKDQYGFLKTPK